MKTPRSATSMVGKLARHAMARAAMAVLLAGAAACGQGNLGDDSISRSAAANSMCSDGSCQAQEASPCEPNPCTADHKTTCTVVSDSEFMCECDAGFGTDPDGVCIEGRAVAEWTFMVYLNADNNLEPDGNSNLKQMQAVGSTSKVNIVVLMDTMNGNGGRARKLLVTKGGNTVLADLGEVDMGVPETLASFGTWAVGAYPANHYALVLWDHGGGWSKSGSVLRDFSNDETSGNSISVANGQYAAGLAPIVKKIGGPIDLVGFDACLMAMWEVANATAPYAKVLVASEETEPGAGWVYDKLLAPLAANPSLAAKDFGAKIVDAYYSSGSSASTQGVIDLTTMQPLNAALSAFATELTKALPSLRTKIDQVRDATQSYELGDDYDLYDFATRVAAISGAPASLKAAAQALTAQIGKSVTYVKVQSSYRNSHGLSIALPSAGSGLPYGYEEGMWMSLSTWDEFLAAF
jgi:hypothetical protein